MALFDTNADVSSRNRQWHRYYSMSERRITTVLVIRYYLVSKPSKHRPSLFDKHLRLLHLFDDRIWSIWLVSFVRGTVVLFSGIWLIMSDYSGREDVQRQIPRDWENREYIEYICVSIKKITDFLNDFELCSRAKLNKLSEKLLILERKVDYIEARITKGETLN